VEKQPSQVDAQKHEPSNVANDSFMDTDNITDNDSVNSVEQDDDFVIEDCATQLDLAKAYIAMGNTEQAQQALNAVINLGDESQRQQAYQLIVQLANS
jgi:pilus assembly protein FimV